MKPNKAFTVFRITLPVVIAIESILTLLHSLHSPTESSIGHILPWFAGVEAIAALALLFRQTAKVGGWVLLAVFIIALVVHGPVQEMSLFVYAAGVILVMFDRDKVKDDNIS